MRPIALTLLILIALLVSACAGNATDSPLLRAEPGIDSTQSSAPRTLRLYYSDLPDVSKSSLMLVGPAGEYQLRGLHTMAADDLMAEIMEPLEDGDYRVEWRTVLGDDPSVYSGSFAFTVNSQD